MGRRNGNILDLKEKRSFIPTHSTHTHIHTHTHTHTHTPQDSCCSRIISSSFALSGALLSYSSAQLQWRRPRAGLELVYRKKRYETKLPGGGWRRGGEKEVQRQKTRSRQLSSQNCVIAFEKAMLTPPWWIHIHKQKQR